MTIRVEAVYEGDGVLKLAKPVDLKEKTRVNVTIEATTEGAAVNDDRTGWRTSERFVGFIKDAPEGEAIAEQHDKYLYR